MVAPYPVGSPTKFEDATAGTSMTFPKDAALRNGDFAVAFLRTNGTSSTTDFSAPGWTHRGYPFIASDPAGRVMSILTHAVTDAANEPAAWTFIKSDADTRRAGIVVIFRGVDPANPVAGNSVNWDAQNPRVQLNSFAHDAVENGLLVYGWGAEVVTPNATAPVITPGTAIGVASSSGANTAVTRSVVWAGYEPAIVNPTGHKNLTWTSSTGSAATGFVLRGLSTPAPTPQRGFRSVAEMLGKPGATWAHRGGSTTWPEMSRYAYEQAVLAGYGALEFSANRTSDGVWIGAHDASLNRTSQTTGLPDISAMTWAQVQTYQNSLNANGTPRPYYRLDEFLDTFTPTHVVIVDPKHAIGAHDTEFLNLLDAHGGRSKIVVKFYGVGSGATALADKAKAKGYETWGYFYEADVTAGALATSQSHWSILGMNYDAPQSAWDAVLAFGKPVVGHIAATQANYGMAIAKGARMVQSAGVAAITAVGATSVQPWDALYVGGKPVDAVYSGATRIWP